MSACAAWAPASAANAGVASVNKAADTAITIGFLPALIVSILFIFKPPKNGNVSAVETCQFAAIPNIHVEGLIHLVAATGAQNVKSAIQRVNIVTTSLIPETLPDAMKRCSEDIIPGYEARKRRADGDAQQESVGWIPVHAWRSGVRQYGEGGAI
jgi:hypothetical protein